jgi:hypothetical protein
MYRSLIIPIAMICVLFGLLFLVNFQCNKAVVKSINEVYDEFDCIDGKVWKTIKKSDGSTFKRIALEDGNSIDCKKEK